ncbi:MAG: hypothetical protein ACPGVV_08560 [Croceimicrobium sp.]
MKRFSFFSLCLLLSISSCKNDRDDKCFDPSNRECENYDPCLAKKPVSADFVMEQQFSISGALASVYRADSVFPSGRRVKFRALEDSAYYRWELGTEVVEGFNKQEVSRALTLNLGHYSPRLSISKSPDSICHPQDDGIDVKTKSFQVISACETMIINRFKGVFNDLPDDSLIIEFYFGDFQARPSGPGCSKSLDIWAVDLLQQNSAYIPKYDTIPTIFDLNDGLSDTYVEWVGSGSGSMKGHALLDRNKKTISLDFSYANISRQFNGKIIP